MNSLITTSQPASSVVNDDLTEDEWSQLELLEDLPARLEPEALAAILELYQQGKTPRTISSRIRLHRLVVTLELSRELRRRVRRQHHADEGTDENTELPRLTRREWNRLAKGSHVPNQPLRQMLETAIRLRPGFSEKSVLAAAHISDVTHVKRLLGISRYSKAKRASEIIECKRAASIALALGASPREVPGL